MTGFDLCLPNTGAPAEYGTRMRANGVTGQGAGDPTASRLATERLRAEDDHQGDQEQIVTAQHRRVTVNGPL
jgi:hypothetical protein